MVVLCTCAGTVPGMPAKDKDGRSRWRSLVEWGSVLAGLALVVLTLIALAGGDEGAPTTSSGSTVLTGRCDTAVAPDDPCPTLPSIEEDSLDGARERFQNDVVEPDDVRFLLLAEDESADVLTGVLGTVEFVPGAPVEELLSEAKLLGTAAQRATWQQEWRGDDAALVEQIFVFDGSDQARAVLAAWRDASEAQGMKAITSPEFLALFPDGSIGDASFTTSFVDPAAVGFFEQRRCATQTMAAIGPALLVVTLFQGPDCQALRPAVPAGLVKVLEPRIRALLIP